MPSQQPRPPHHGPASPPTPLRRRLALLGYAGGLLLVFALSLLLLPADSGVGKLLWRML